MSYSTTLLTEFDHEMASTTTVLERLPAEKWSWKPHPRSNSIGWNASHIAEIPGWIEGTLTGDSWDLWPVGGTKHKTELLVDPDDALELFSKNTAQARAALSEATEDQITKEWSLLEQGQTLMTMPRQQAIRLFMLNHIYHHRAILCVYLRLNDVPVPGMYGPSGD